MSSGDARIEMYEVLLEEHRQLRALLADIGALFAQQRDQIKDATIKLRQLDEQVNVHFQAEEASDCFPELVSNSPRVSDRVMNLLGEHGELRAEIHGIVQDAVQSEDGAEDWQRLAAAFEQFASKLVAHEQAENELVQEVFTEDIGSKD